MALTKPTRRGRHDHPVPREQDDPVPGGLDFSGGLDVCGGHRAQENGEPGSPPELPDEVLRLCLELNDAGYTAEIRLGQVVVSPVTSRQSADIVDRLYDLLYPLKLANRWRLYQTWGVHIPPLPDLRLPDLTVAPDEAEQYDEMRARGYSLLLVVEVCSPGTRKVDWQEKPLDYARAGVPLLLIVDPVATPRRVTLMSDPLSDLEPFDYQRQPYRQIVTAEEGEVLELPEPFGIKIETDVLFSRRKTHRDPQEDTEATPPAPAG